MPRLRAFVVACAVSATTLGLASPAFADPLLPQTIDFTQPTGGPVGTTEGLQATAPGGSVEFTVDPTTDGFGDDTLQACTIDTGSSTVDYNHAGNCVIDANQPGDGLVYDAAPQEQRTAAVTKLDQTITFTQPAGGAAGSYETLSATATSELTVTFSSLTSDICSVTGDQVSYDHAGTCTVAADQAGDNDYNPATQVKYDVTVATLDQTVTLDAPAGGPVGTSEPLSATASSSLPVTFSTTTPDYCTIDGDQVDYDHAGTCTVVAHQDGKDANGQATDYAPADSLARDTTVSRLSQTITVGSTVPTSLSLHGAYIDDPLSSDITASSTLPVTATVNDAGTSDNGLGKACSVVATSTGFTVRADHAGTCAVDLAQDGKKGIYQDYDAATAPLSFTVTKGAQHVDLDAIRSSAPTVGNTYTLPVTTVEQAGDQQPSPLHLSPQSSACTVDDATHVLTLVHAGSCTLLASAAGTADYNDLTNGTLQAITIGKGASTVSVKPTSTKLTATVRQADGTGAVIDGATVTFSVAGKSIGTATVAHGVATLTKSVPTGATRVISARYAGSSDLTSSTSSYTRKDPTISITSVRSSVAKSKYGWYRKPVTTTFTCRAGSATVTSCTKPVTVTANGRSRAITGKATTADGGAATVTTHVNIDTTAPTVKVTGPANGAIYVGTAPKARCVGSDALSGLAACALRLVPHANGVFTYAASAVDKAGNTARVTGRYQVMNRYIRGVTFDGTSNAYLVTAGSKVTLVALAATRPTYLLPVPAGQTPHVAGHAFYHDGRQANSPRWSLTVTLPTSMRAHVFWNIGIKVGKTVYNVKVRVTG